MLFLVRCKQDDVYKVAV